MKDKSPHCTHCLIRRLVGATACCGCSSLCRWELDVMLLVLLTLLDGVSLPGGALGGPAAALLLPRVTDAAEVPRCEESIRPLARAAAEDSGGAEALLRLTPLVSNGTVMVCSRSNPNHRENWLQDDQLIKNVTVYEINVREPSADLEHSNRWHTGPHCSIVAAPRRSSSSRWGVQRSPPGRQGSRPIVRCCFVRELRVVCTNTMMQ
jgi:hypothetical protein